MTTTDIDPTHPVTQRLREAGITSAVVIDDAYNPPAFDDLGVEIPLFWAAIIRHQDALDELKSIEPSFVDDSDFDEELIKKLWYRHINGELSSLSLSCQHVLFPRQVERLSELAPFVNNLTGIGITPILLGTGDNLPEEQLKLFFLDFFLESNPTPLSNAAVEGAIQRLVEGAPEDPAIQASIDKAKQILRQFDDAFIILMSSKDGVERARDRFRVETGLIEGMFDYASKEQLASERDLHLRLGISAVGLPVRHEIQRFVNALEASVKDATKEFVSRIKSLSFEDYLYVYSLSLRTEGHPLGDYMSWLYKSLLGHLVIDHDRVIEARNKLDSIDMEAYVPLKRAPSTDLADIYRLSLTEPAPSTEAKHLRLGDLYVNGTRDVLLVINADCDLVHSTQSPSRPFPAKLSILLHPGRLKSVDKRPDARFKVTELFILDGQAFKIVWDHEGVITKKYDEVEKWLGCEGYSKKARLIAPHALEIQHHFAANMTRVGLPVAPPLPRTATVQVFGKNEDQTLEKLGADIPKGVVIDREGFRFTWEGARDLQDGVEKGIKHYTELRDSYDNSHGRYGRLERNIERLEELLQDCAVWFALMESSKEMPNENGKQLGPNGIFRVFCTPNLTNAESLIAINLLPDEWIIGTT